MEGERVGRGFCLLLTTNLSDSQIIRTLLDSNEEEIFTLIEALIIHRAPHGFISLPVPLSLPQCQPW